MSVRKLLLAAVAAVAVSGLANTASAGTSVESLFKYGVPQGTYKLNTLSDDDREMVVDNGQIGTLDVGDVIYGYGVFNQLGAAGNPSVFLGANGNNQLNVAFRVLVTGKTGSGADSVFTFGPDASWGLAGPLGVAGKAMAIFYEANPGTADVFDEANLATDVASGSPFWALGFSNPAQAAQVQGGLVVPGNGEGWVAYGGDNLVGLSFLEQGNTFGASNFALNQVGSSAFFSAADLVISTRTGTLLAPTLGSALQPLVQGTAKFIGSATNTGAYDPQLPPAQQSSFDLFSDMNVNFAVTVPLPSSVAAGGLALLSMVAVQGYRRMRRS